jgi:hypothetical protein
MHMFVWPSPKAYSPDEPAMDVLGYILGTGNNSIIYKTFTKPERAFQAYSYNYSSELAGELAIAFIANPFLNMYQTLLHFIFINFSYLTYTFLYQFFTYKFFS